MKYFILILCIFSKLAFSQVATTIEIEGFTNSSTTNDVSVYKTGNTTLDLSTRLLLQHRASTDYQIKFVLSKTDKTIIVELCGAASIIWVDPAGIDPYNDYSYMYCNTNVKINYTNKPTDSYTAYLYAIVITPNGSQIYSDPITVNFEQPLAPPTTTPGTGGGGSTPPSPSNYCNNSALNFNQIFTLRVCIR